MPTPTHQDLLAQIAGKFGQVLPDSREKCLIVILLHLKIEGGMMDAAFTEGELDATMKEVEDYLLREKTIRPERPTRELTGYFLNYDRRGNRYRLTQYGVDFARLILEKVQGAMNPESLRLIFRNTFQLHAGDQDSIETLEHWHETQFVQTSKRRIEGVLDALEESMHAAFEALEGLMDWKSGSFREVLTGYRERFAEIRTKSDDMRETIEARQEVMGTLKGLESRFEQNRDEWERYLRVERSISEFFERIDDRLASVYLHVDQAVKKLGLLYENFRYKRAYRLRLEQFLQRLLTQSRREGDGIHLPEGLTLPELVGSREKFVVPPEQIGISRKRSVAVDAEVDAAEVELEWERQKALLERQGLIDQWTARIEKMVLAASGPVDVSAVLYNIVEEGGTADVALSVASNLLWRFGDRAGFTLAIDAPTTDEVQHESLVLWKMLISPTAS